jgi:hypothetical protein
MNARHPSRQRRRRLLAVALAAAALAAGCDTAGGETGSQAGTTMPTPETTVRYENDILLVGGIAIRQFPGYRPSTFHKMHLRWKTLDAMVLDSRTDEADKGVVRAAVFRDSEAIAADPWAPIADAEWNLGDRFAQEGTVLAEDTIRGADRTCSLRVRHGILGEEPGPTDMSLPPPHTSESLQGTVIATGAARPALGITLDGYIDVPIEQLLREIAATLCP